MRFIEYRIWDFNRKRMIYGVTDVGHRDKLKRIVMRGTRLKDKSGKEIYEGDMVAAPGVIGEIKQRIDGLWIIYPEYQDGAMCGLDPDEQGNTNVTIIGNVYEGVNE